VGQARELRRDKDDGGGGGARQCCMHHGNADVKGASRRADDAQWEDKDNNANAACKHCQREPMHNGRDRGGGQHDKRRWRTMMDDDNGQ
jgi:hypothetical protein